MAFEISGGTPAPLIKGVQVGETMYVGQLAMSGTIGGAGGHVQIADAASEALENDQPILGVVSAVLSGDRTYDSTYNGDKCTYTTTQATVASTGAGTVSIARIIPEVTLVKGPIYDTAYKTALTVCTVTTADSGGTTVTHANDTVTDIADDYATVYCRTGANRGLYRVITTVGTNAQVVTVPFPYAIAVGDTFVVAACVLGMGRLAIPATADCIDGDNALSSYYPVYYHEINLEESGKEYAVFSLSGKAAYTGA